MFCDIVTVCKGSENARGSREFKVGSNDQVEKSQPIILLLEKLSVLSRGDVMSARAPDK